VLEKVLLLLLKFGRNLSTPYEPKLRATSVIYFRIMTGVIFSLYINFNIFPTANNM
jgi:hypothetical protein